MLATFLITHRAELIARTREKLASRSARSLTEGDLDGGVPLFLDQLVEALRVSSTGTFEIARSAGLHGSAVSRRGFSVARVVHDYGDVCQAVTELAGETNAPITVDEFHTLNRCLDDAIAEAVTQYTAQRERSISESGTYRLGTVVHEVRGKLSTAMMAFSLLEKGDVAIGGSTGKIMKRSLTSMSTLLDRSFAEVRLASGAGYVERVLVSELVEQIDLDGSIDADARGLGLTCEPGEPGVFVTIDRLLITAALANLLHNAFKFTRADGHVRVRTTTTPEHVRFEIEDECGGLPVGRAEELFLPFEQRGADRTGLGLGLDIARRSVEASGGRLEARDIPGVGCVFTMELPR